MASFDDEDYADQKIKPDASSKRKFLLKDRKDVHESEKLLAEIDGLKWLQRQIARYSRRIVGTNTCVFIDVAYVVKSSSSLKQPKTR